MSVFRYEAIDQTGKIVMGAMDAPSEAAVSARLTQMGYRPQVVGSASGSSPSSKAARNTTTLVVTGSTKEKASAKELALFFRQLASMVRAGISQYQALDTLAPKTLNPDLARVAREMADAARSGKQISRIMANYPALFPEHVVGGVEGGELGGFVEIVLDEIALEYEQELAFYKGMWLPKTLLIQQLFAIALAQPLFPTLFPNGDFKGYVALVLLRNVPIALAVIFAVRYWLLWLKRPEQTPRRDAMLLRIPIFGDLSRQRALAAFVRMLRRLFNAGIGPIGAWEGAMRVAPNWVIREKLQEANTQIRQNVPLHDAFAATGLFANETEQLLATGMVSGQMVEMLDRVATYYQDNVDRVFKNAKFWMYRLSISLFIAMGGAVAIIMAKSYFGAIFSFAEGFTE